MKSIILLVLVLSALSHKVEESNFAKFMKFTSEHKKLYATAEEFKARFEVFEKNLKVVEIMTAVNSMAGENQTFNYGVTQFMDISPEEFKAKYLTLRVGDLQKLREKSGELKINPRMQEAPESHDWRTLGAVSSVKNQGICGSCWAFSAVGNLEGQHQIKFGGNVVDLSPQQLVDCDKVDQGCNGGFMDQAFDYIKSAGGIEALSDYAYTGSDDSCKFDVSKSVVKVTGNAMATSQDEDIIKTLLFQTGPLAVALNATPLQFYFFGIFNPWFSWICDPSELNHGVLMVGYGVEGSTNYWIVKNSWGASWGEKGYFRIIRGKGACGINTYVVNAFVQ